jgi:hypothetical protein
MTYRSNGSRPHITNIYSAKHLLNDCGRQGRKNMNHLSVITNSRGDRTVAAALSHPDCPRIRITFRSLFTIQLSAHSRAIARSHDFPPCPSHALAVNLVHTRVRHHSVCVTGWPAPPVSMGGRSALPVRPLDARFAAVSWTEPRWASFPIRRSLLRTRSDAPHRVDGPDSSSGAPLSPAWR